MKILVIQQKMIGDVLTSSILFEALRLKYPNAQLDYLINEHTFPVVQNMTNSGKQDPCCRITVLGTVPWELCRDLMNGGINLCKPNVSGQRSELRLFQIP